MIAAERVLTCHPDCKSETVRRVFVALSRKPDRSLAVAYVVEGEIGRLRIPSRRTPSIRERLWQHTCCEIFIAHTGSTGYHEFNFSPSGEWAAYAFRRYRESMPLNNEKLDPQISVRNTAGRLELDAVVPLHRLFPGQQAELSIALSVVIEDDSGALTYWALRHPPGKPDFHHPEAFALVLDEVRT